MQRLQKKGEGAEWHSQSWLCSKADTTYILIILEAQQAANNARALGALIRIAGPANGKAIDLSIHKTTKPPKSFISNVYKKRGGGKQLKSGRPKSGPRVRK